MHVPAISTPSSLSATQGDRRLFVIGSLVLVTSAAALAGLFPVWFSVAIVVTFGAPHNWTEFRYFLSRLPSKLGPFKHFFVTAFGGALLLCATEIALMSCLQEKLIPSDLARQFVFIWNQLLIFWIIALFFLRYRVLSKELIILCSGLGTVITVANFLAPQVFTMSLLYVHPLMGLWIFERELRRTRKSWLKSYHLCLLSIPLAISVLILWLSNSVRDAACTQTLIELSGNVGSSLFKSSSPEVVLAVYGFLQMVHYGIWIIAMPIATSGWQRWRLDRLPVLKGKMRLRRIIGLIIAAGALALFGFWVGFKIDYYTTMSIYVVLSTLHVLAEAPFMFWMCES